ncbi:MAG TPA: hypothetical protein VGL02_09270, partial [Streptomyces sp.]
MSWPPEHWLFQLEPSVVAKQPAGTPMNAEPAAKTSGYSAGPQLRRQHQAHRARSDHRDIHDA